MRAWSTLFSAALIRSALADTHYAYSGFFSGSVVVGLEFDDVANTLAVAQNFTVPSSNGQKWIALDVSRPHVQPVPVDASCMLPTQSTDDMIYPPQSRLQNLYVATTGYFQSFSIGSDMSLTYKTNVSSVTVSDSCTNGNHIAVSTASPYNVYGIVYGDGCSTVVMSVDEDGALDSHIANATYDTSAGIHGAWLSPDNDFLYSADDIGNGVWAHSIDTTTQTVQEIQHLDAAESSDPRHLTVHPNGLWVYVIYEAGNSVAVYSRDNSTGELTFTNTTYSLLPDGFTNGTESYWADECLISVPSSNSSATSPKYLIAATRSRTSTIPGYVSAFALDAETGAITEQLFLLETTGSGGSANSVTPAKFSEEYFAITDSAANFVEVWKIDGNTASAVAHVDTESGPANVQWFS